MTRSQGTLAYCAILFTAIAAFCGAPMWSALFGAAVLFKISLNEQRKLVARFSSIGANHVLNMAAWQSAGHALMAGGAAWVLGAIVRLPA